MKRPPKMSGSKAMQVRSYVLPGRQPGESFNKMLARVFAVSEIKRLGGGPFEPEERARLAKYLGVGPGDKRLQVLELALFRLQMVRMVETGRELQSAETKKLQNLGVALQKVVKPFESVIERILKLPAPMRDIVQEAIQDAVSSTAAIRSEAITLADVAVMVRGLAAAFDGPVGRPREWFAAELTYQLGLAWRAARGRSPNLDTARTKRGASRRPSLYSGAFPQFVRAAFAIVPGAAAPGDGVLDKLLERFPRLTKRGKHSFSEKRLNGDWRKLCAEAKELLEIAPTLGNSAGR
jgi:hypothetical protein